MAEGLDRKPPAFYIEAYVENSISRTRHLSRLTQFANANSLFVNNSSDRSLLFPDWRKGDRNIRTIRTFEPSEYGSFNKAASSDPNEVPHWSVGSYYSIENGLTATLMLNNKGIAPLVVQPTLYSKNGQQFEPPPVVVAPNSFTNINLNDWIQLGGPDYTEGNIRLFHTGKNLVLGAQIYLVNEAKSFSFEEKLAELGTFDSRRLEGIFTVPSKQTQVKKINAGV